MPATIVAVEIDFDVSSFAADAAANASAAWRLSGDREGDGYPITIKRGLALTDGVRKSRVGHAVIINAGVRDAVEVAVLDKLGYAVINHRGVEVNEILVVGVVVRVVLRELVGEGVIDFVAVTLRVPDTDIDALREDV